MQEVLTFSWDGTAGGQKPWGAFEFVTRRIAHVLMDTSLDPEGKTIRYDDGGAVFDRKFALAGVPVRNQVNRLRVEWGDAPILLALRCTDAFGEILIELRSTEGKAVAWSNTINRIMQGGFSHSSPMPEETMIERIGRFEFPAVGAGTHQLIVSALEETVSVEIDGKVVLSFDDPDVAAGRFGIGSSGKIRVASFEQKELITDEEMKSREEFVRRMEEFGKELDKEYGLDIARHNDLSIKGDRLKWSFPESNARVVIEAEEGSLSGSMNAGLYGDARLLKGAFANPVVRSVDGEKYRIAVGEKPVLEGDETHFHVTAPLESDSGKKGRLRMDVRFTRNATWFWTAKIREIDVEEVEIHFALDGSFPPSTKTTEFQEKVLCTDHVVGHFWQRISGQDTEIAIQERDQTPTLVLRSKQNVFRWAGMWLPMHRLNLKAYKTRMLHFIRFPETPVQEWRERPSKCEYPTDEELQRFALGGVEAMVWHHTWTSNNYRKRDGFIVNETEMRRAMRTAHDLGISVIPYIGIVPGRHPVLRYEDLGGPYEKNWDLQDFTFYSVGGRFYDFFPYMTDSWCREYGIDGYYADGGLVGMTWGFTGKSEEDCDGLSLEELNDRFYSRVVRLLDRHNAGFGLENWGGDAIKTAAPYYTCRMIGESFQEATPETYRDKFNALLTGTPFKMYGMDLTARNRYNIAMAAVCMTDIQICSGCNAWGNWPDRPSDWENLLPFWEVLNSIDWDNLLDARPWWAQKLIDGDGFYAGNYTTPERAVIFLANKEEEWSRAAATIKVDELPEELRRGQCRKIYPETGEYFDLGEGLIESDLPPLHHGPVGFEIVP